MGNWAETFTRVEVKYDVFCRPLLCKFVTKNACFCELPGTPLPATDIYRTPKIAYLAAKYFVGTPYSGVTLLMRVPLFS